MLLEEYDFDLPQELIAQTPAEPRDASRLLLLGRNDGSTRHHHVRDLPDLLRPGDALVFNDTKVLHARLRARRRATGGRVELLLLRPLAGGRWEAMARPARRLREGEALALDSGAEVHVRRGLVSGTVEIELPGDVAGHLDRHGELPLPPYIHSYAGDPGRYQTVYARPEGSVAAPTAGLHFTPGLLDSLRCRGVSTHFLTLHVGLGTFKPVQTERVEDHEMHAERFYVPPQLLSELEEVRGRGGRVIAVGTTSVRALESAAAHPELAGAWSETRIFITPGHRFRLVDGLLTNFHLPRSTLLLLVSALAGREAILRAYGEAIRERYRFYSFGDAMLIL